MRHPHIVRFTLAALVAVGLPALVGAQLPERPRLPDSADPNDWEAYYDYALKRLLVRAGDADAAFVWASRLNPTRAEPYYGRYVAYWLRHVNEFERYLKGDERESRAPATLAAEELRRTAIRRNPFVHQGLEVAIYDRLPGRWREDSYTRAWITYARGNLPLALDQFRNALRSDRDAARVHSLRAGMFVNLGNLDSAKSEVVTALAQLDAREAKTLDAYESKELLAYAIGLIDQVSGRPNDAKAAFGRAIVENPAFAPAHAHLAELATAVRDTAAAYAELALAVDIDANDPMLRVAYARALLAGRRLTDAMTQAQLAHEVAPDWAEPLLVIATILDSSGDKDRASAAYTTFLSAAAQNDPNRGFATQRLALLGAAH